MNICGNCRFCNECCLTSNGRKEDWLECSHPENRGKIVRHTGHCMYWEERR